jgi:hypothetical protein
MTNDVTVKPAPDTADPTLRLELGIEYQHRYRVPLRLAGQVKSELGVLVGDLIVAAIPANGGKFPVLPRSTQNEPVQRWAVTGDCRLSPMAVWELLRAREANSKKDVILELALLFTTLQPSYRLVGLPGANQPDTTVAVEMTSQGPGIGEVATELVTLRVVIHSSDWAHDYAPAFGVGRFTVVELPVLDAPVAAGHTLSEKLARAAGAVSEMTGDIRAGDWTDCVEHSRSVMELLKTSRADVKALLVQDGLSDAAAEDLLNSVQAGFDFASKFIHEAGPDRKLNPALVARKEDAYYVYAASTGLVDLVARKVARHLKG